MHKWQESCKNEHEKGGSHHLDTTEGADWYNQLRKGGTDHCKSTK